VFFYKVIPRSVLLILGIAVLSAARLCAAAPAQVESPAWPHELGDLAPDPAIVWGRLPNGLRYAVRSSPEPRGRINLCLLVDAGSRNERPDQQGYAHFVEHMAFKGTRHFPSGTLIKTLQRHGMTFGAEVSAFTTLSHTFYNLSLAGNSAAALDEGLGVLRDFADAVVFSPEDISTEKGVILSERRARDSGMERSGWGRTCTIYANTSVPNHKPIGTASCIGKADRAGLLEYYDSWYRPGRMIVIAVGDATTEMLAEHITRLFGDLQARSPALREPDWEYVKPAPGTRAALFTETESGGGISVEIACVQPAVLPRRIASARTEIARTVACDVLAMRLQTEVKNDRVSFGGSSASWTEYFGAFTEASVGIQSKSSTWRRALVTTEHELRRAWQRGFNQSEIRLSVDSIRASARHALDRASTRKSEELIQEILGALIAGQVVQSPADRLARIEPVLASLTPAECLDAFRGLFPENGRLIFVCGSLRLSNPGEELAEIYDSSRRFPLAEADEEQRIEFGYADFGPTGIVADRKEVPDLGITQVRFANGLSLNLKKTDYEAGTVSVRVRVGGGLATEPADKPGLGLIASFWLTGGGLGRHDLESLEKILRGRTLRLGFAVEDDACVFTGTSDPANVRLLFRLIAAYMTDPGWRPEGWAGAIGQINTFYSTVSTDTTRLAGNAGVSMITRGDSRYTLPHYNGLSTRSSQEVRAWIEPQMTGGPIEVAVVGDIDMNGVIAVIADTLGALPKRPPRSSLPVQAIQSPAKAASSASSINSQTPKASIWLGWVVPGVEQVSLVRRAHMLADILGDRIRVKIREEHGASYDSDATVWTPSADQRFGCILVRLTAPPEKARELVLSIERIAADIARNGVTADEFTRAREPILASLEQEMRNNTYWLYSVMDHAEEQPFRLDWPRTRISDYRSMTRDEISTLARRCLGSSQVFSYIVFPKR